MAQAAVGHVGFKPLVDRSMGVGALETMGGNVSSTLLTIAQAAELLSFKTSDATRNLLRELGVRPIDLGLGRGRGHRYYRHEILAALENRRSTPAKKAQRKPKPAALDAKVAATQKAIQAENELRQTKAEAQKDVAKAEGEAQALMVAAKARAASNKMISESLTPLLIERNRIEKWDGRLPQVSGGATPFVNLNGGK